MNGKIKIKQAELISTKENGELVMNQNLAAFISSNFESAQVGYDVGIKLAQAVKKALEDFETQRIALCEKMAEETEYKQADGSTAKTKRVVIKDKEGAEQIVGNRYNLGKNIKEFNESYKEILALEVELNAYPIKLSRLLMEDCSSFKFAGLDNFINNDIEEIQAEK